MSHSIEHPFFSAGEALDSVREVLEGAGVVRIATAYFEPSCWRLLRDLLADSELRLLLGRRETKGGSEELWKAVLEEFLEALRSDDAEERTNALFSLRNAMRGFDETKSVSL